MKKTVTVISLLGLLCISLATFSCKKQKQECVICNATCPGSTSSTEMKNCGDDNDAMEQNFRNQNQGCTINCVREKK